MATGVRVFIVGSDGSVRRLPVARYDALIRREPEGALPEYAGKRVRAAILFVEIEGRRPVGLTRAEFGIWRLDKHGFLDEAHERRLRRAAVQDIALGVGLTTDPFEKQRSLFCRKQAEHEDRWKPTPELEAYLVALALGRG